MKRTLTPLLCLLLISFVSVHAQTYYVDAKMGKSTNPGTITSPFNSINVAVKQSNSLTGVGEIVIKLLPGTYILEERVDLNPVRMLSDTTRYIIEAAIMPNDDDWTPEKMPVIQSVSDNNSNTQFPHSTGFLVASKHVSIRGLKFLGNPNPNVFYYYPISKENQDLSDLVISQCYFIGDKEASKIQGGVWAHGPQNKVSHCIFYGCRNAVLFFNNIDGFTIEHTIVYGSYESAFWLGNGDYHFTFTNNIITNNTRFLVGPKEPRFTSSFSNSVIANNEEMTGYWSSEGVIDSPTSMIQLNNISKEGVVRLQNNTNVKLDKFHLHLTKDSKGVDLKAGIF